MPGTDTPRLFPGAFSKNKKVCGDPIYLLTKVITYQFQAEYPKWPVVLRITFTEEPDQLILDLLYKCQAWVNDYGAALEIEIGRRKIHFAEQG